MIAKALAGGDGLGARLLSDLNPAGKAALSVFVALLAAAPFLLDDHWLSVLIFILYFGYLGQAWNLMLGFAGLLSIGHALFVGIGAYASASLFYHYGLPPMATVVLAAALAVAAGCLVGYLGFRFAIGGVYFALLTIAFAEFTRIVVDHIGWFGGAQGMFLKVEAVRGWDLVNLHGPPSMFYYVMLLLALAALALCRLLLTGRLGYHWRAVRDDPEAAAALGVHLFRTRMQAVAISSAMAGIAGVWFAFFQKNLFPAQMFPVAVSIEITLGPIVGGVGTLFGPIFGTFVLRLLSEFLIEGIDTLKTWKVIDPALKLDGIKEVFWGVVVASIVLLQPRGLWPWVRDRLRLLKPPEQRS